MKITPIEIRQKTFEKTFRGYEKQEVHAFLSSLAKEWERMQTDYKELKTKCDQVQKENAKLREMEESLFKTLKTAEDTRTSLIDQASKTAELHMKETHIKAESVLAGAKNRAQDVLERAEEKAAQIAEDAQQEIRNLQRRYADVEHHRDQLIGSLRLMAEDLLDKVKRMESAKPTKVSFDKHMAETRKLQTAAREDTNKSRSAISSSPSASKQAPLAEEPLSSMASVPAQEAEEHNISKQRPSNGSSKGSFFDELE